MKNSSRLTWLFVCSWLVAGSAVAAPAAIAPNRTRMPAPDSSAVPRVEPLPRGVSPFSVARIWDEALLDAIRIDRPKPPVHARNLFHLSVAMWDAWAAYDATAIGYLTTEKQAAVDVEAARNEAISHAAFRLLMHRFPGGGIDPDGVLCQPGAATSQAEFEATMLSLGYDPTVDTTVGDTPAALGNRIGQAVIDYGLSDNAYEGSSLCYPDDSGYQSINPPMVFELPGTLVVDPNHWQPLAFDYLVLQNGIVIGFAVQRFVGVAWGDTHSFANPPVPPGGTPDPVDCTTGIGALSPIFNPGCPPQLGGVGDAQVKEAMVELIRFSASVDPSDGVEIDLSPSAHGNNTLGADDGTGRPVNPYTGLPYPPNVVKYGDWARVIAEFWADGPHSETPPGHWNTLANYVTEHPDLGPKRLGGTGPLLTDLEWDVKLYLAINGAVHDAAIAAWGTKHFYDSSRPLTLIRYMAGKGQSSDPALPSYDPDGLPLVPGLIELITPASSAPGQRHAHLAAYPNQIAIRAWLGEPADPVNQTGGVGWIRGVEWITYQASFFVTPPFPGYTSGHSTFSRAGAEALAAFTGSPYFPGGLGSFTAPAGDFLDFEDGPSETVELQWATYADAADEAGLSRRYGGIHPNYDDYPGRIQGAGIGRSAWARALQFYNQPLDLDAKVTICHIPPGNPGNAHTISVSRNALPAHLAHGDSEGPCPEQDPEQTQPKGHGNKRGR